MSDEQLSREDLVKILQSGNLTEGQEAKLKEVLTLEASDRQIHIEDGFDFLRDLRKEARRQKKMRRAEAFEVQSREIACVPNEVPSNVEELTLADSFEIIEE